MTDESGLCNESVSVPVCTVRVLLRRCTLAVGSAVVGLEERERERDSGGAETGGEKAGLKGSERVLIVEKIVGTGRGE